MKPPRPTAQDIAELVAFLPQLYAEGFEPIDRWGGGTRDAQGAISMPWPEYNAVVEAFFNTASQECWMDYEYVPAEAGPRVADDAFIRQASLDEIKTLLTYCVRGERFTSGFWAGMIREGCIKLILERLQQIQMPNSNAA